MAIKDLTQCERHLFLCNGSSCLENGAAEITTLIREEIRSLGLHDRVHTTKTLCNGRCDDGPIVIVAPDSIWYKYVGTRAAKQIVYQHLKNNRPVEEQVLYRWGSETLQTD